MAKIYGALEVAQLEWFTDAGKPAASSYIYRVIYVSDLKQVMVSDGSNWIPFLNTSTNQTVNGNITFAGQQIFNGLHRLSVTTDSSSTGAVTALNNVTPVIEFTAAVTSISGIVNSASGATVMLVNRTGGTIAVLDEDTGATAANRIRTGTGAQISLANNASIILTYVGDNRWHIVGGSGSGSGSAEINYITNGSAEADTLGWAVYADAAGTSPVDGTGGSANVTITRTTTTPLIGTASFLLAKDAANRQGQGWSYDFTIDLANRAKVLQISFDYLVSSGTFVAGATGSDSDVTVWIYDITNAVLIQPSNIKLFSNNASITDKFQASFQTASNSSNYRLILHVASTSASAYTLEVDGVSVSPSQYVFGTPVTDWQSYTPTFGAGFGTATNISFFWRRVGSSLQVKGTFVTGTVAASLGTISLPGVSIDTSKISINNTSANAGGEMGAYQQNGAAQYTGAIVTATATSTTVVYFASQRNMSTALIPTNISSVISSGATTSVYFELPIAGWSSSVQTSDSADTRVVDFVGTVTAQTLTANTTNLALTSVKDSHGVWSTNQFTVPVAGDYVITGTVSTSSTLAFSLEAYVGGSSVCALGANQTTTASRITLAGLLPNLQAGQVITIRANQTVTINTPAVDRVSIFRLSGPSAIAATETVAASYWCSANTTASTTTPINFDSREYDTHIAVTTGASWKFTVPISGTYSVSVYLYGGGSVTEYPLYKNGVAYKSMIYQAAGVITSGTVMLKLNAGDYIDIRPSASRTITGAVLSNVYASYIQILREGN